jgi:hypothetical protein
VQGHHGLPVWAMHILGNMTKGREQDLKKGVKAPIQLRRKDCRAEGVGGKAASVARELMLLHAHATFGVDWEALRVACHMINLKTCYVPAHTGINSTAVSHQDTLLTSFCRLPPTAFSGR